MEKRLQMQNTRTEIRLKSRHSCIIYSLSFWQSGEKENEDKHKSGL